MVRPVDPKWHMSDEEVNALQRKNASAHAGEVHGSFGIGTGGLTPLSALAWTIVGVPIAWGAWQTLQTALKLFS
jgi:hypothetical protein